MGCTELKVQMNQSGLLIKLATMNFLLFFVNLHDSFRSGKSNCQMKKGPIFYINCSNSQWFQSHIRQTLNSEAQIKINNLKNESLIDAILVRLV